MCKADTIGKKTHNFRPARNIAKIRTISTFHPKAGRTAARAG